MTLPAGTFLFRLPSRGTARRVIQVLSEDRETVYTMLQTIPIRRTQITRDPEVIFKETPAGEPPMIRALFQPRERTGYEFLYPNASDNPVGKVAIK